MEAEELEQRLMALEQAHEAEMQKAAQQAFMNKYGSRISNNEPLGLVILNELNRQGIDTSAADEAVSRILDQIRMESQMLLDTIQDLGQEAASQIDRVDSIQQAVSTAQAMTGADMSMASQVMPPEAQGAMPPEGAGDDMGTMPPEGGAPDAGAGAPPPEGGAPDAGAGAPPPEGTPSDRRIKSILRRKTTVSDKGMKQIRQPSGQTLARHIIAACAGGM